MSQVPEVAGGLRGPVLARRAGQRGRGGHVGLCDRLGLGRRGRLNHGLRCGRGRYRDGNWLRLRFALRGGLAGGLLGAQPFDQRGARVMADRDRFRLRIDEARPRPARFQHGVERDQREDEHAADDREVFQQAGHQAWHGLHGRFHSPNAQ